jgi:hypothetical protein
MPSWLAGRSSLEGASLLSKLPDALASSLMVMASMVLQHADALVAIGLKWASLRRSIASSPCIRLYAYIS